MWEISGNSYILHSRPHHPRGEGDRTATISAEYPNKPLIREQETSASQVTAPLGVILRDDAVDIGLHNIVFKYEVLLINTSPAEAGFNNLHSLPASQCSVSHKEPGPQFSTDLCIVSPHFNTPL